MASATKTQNKTYLVIEARSILGTVGIHYLSYDNETDKKLIGKFPGVFFPERYKNIYDKIHTNRNALEKFTGKAAADKEAYKAEIGEWIAGHVSNDVLSAMKGEHESLEQEKAAIKSDIEKYTQISDEELDVIVKTITKSVVEHCADTTTLKTLSALSSPNLQIVLTADVNGCHIMEALKEKISELPGSGHITIITDNYMRSTPLNLFESSFEDQLQNGDKIVCAGFSLSQGKSQEFLKEHPGVTLLCPDEGEDFSNFEVMELVIELSQEFEDTTVQTASHEHTAEATDMFTHTEADVTPDIA
jgi:hypothetical protein